MARRRHLNGIIAIIDGVHVSGMIKLLRSCDRRSSIIDSVRVSDGISSFRTSTST